MRRWCLSQPLYWTEQTQMTECKHHIVLTHCHASVSAVGCLYITKLDSYKKRRHGILHTKFASEVRSRHVQNAMPSFFSMRQCSIADHAVSPHFKGAGASPVMLIVLMPNKYIHITLLPADFEILSVVFTKQKESEINRIPLHSW